MGKIIDFITKKILRHEEYSGEEFIENLYKICGKRLPPCNVCENNKWVWPTKTFKMYSSCEKYERDFILLTCTKCFQSLLFNKRGYFKN